MRRFFAVGFIAVLFVIGCVCSSRASVVTDGDWWGRLSREQKVTAVEAVINGVSNGWWLGFTTYDTKIQVALANELMSKEGHSDDKMRFDNEVAKASQEQKSAQPTFSQTFKYYIDRLDQFYAAYPNAHTVQVGTVMHCLSDKPWMSCADIAKQFSDSSKP